MIKSFKNVGIDLSPEQTDKFEKLTKIMLEYNEKVNLTRIVEKDEIIEKHYIDSILPFTMFDLPENSTVIDVGTGAGFPSLPLEIYRPDIKITMLDSLNKRIDYLKYACNLLSLPCNSIHGRSEELGCDDKYREKYDYATARAVANLAALSEYCLPFVKVGGYFIALKGAESEVDQGKNAIEQLGGKIERVISYKLPKGDSRNLIIIKKISQTPTKYPRTSVKISKFPL